MRHRADDNNVPWMDKLVEEEIKGVSKQASVNEEFVATVLGDRNPFGNSIIDKIAADDAAAAATSAPMSMDDIEKQIDSATSVEELDALEDQLKKLNEGGDLGSSDPTAAPSTSEQAPDSGANPVAPAGTDLTSLQGDVAKIKETLEDENKKTNEQLLLEVKKLNQSMGADKVVDLNNTIDQSA